MKRKNMPKLFTCICSLLFLAASLNAQKMENTVATVRYHFKHVVDSTQEESPIIDEMILFLGKKTSVFTSYNEILRDIRVKDFLLKNPAVLLSGLTTYYGAPFIFYKNTETNTLTSYALLKGTNYAIEENVPDIKWNISSETKNIQNYKCQKATASFRGRNYEAWFCSELAFTNGPWKLGGLPGLILEASDTKKEVVFTFKSFEDTASSVMELPTKTIKATTKDLNRAIDAYQDSDSHSGGAALVQQSASGMPVKKKKYNNPIEKE